MTKVLDELEERFRKNKRVTSLKRTQGERGNERLHVCAHGEEFMLEIDDFGEHIRVYRKTPKGMYPYEYMDTLKTVQGICFKLWIME